MPVNRSLRPVRLAALAVALAVPLVVGMAAPGFASGESASAVLSSPTSGSAQTFTWTYTFDQNGGNGLSNVAVGFCSAEILADVVSASPSAVVDPKQFASVVAAGRAGPARRGRPCGDHESVLPVHVAPSSTTSSTVGVTGLGRIGDGTQLGRVGHRSCT